MNKTYRPVWNATTQCWVPAPECARGRGPSSGRAAVLLLGFGLLAHAAVRAACTATPGTTHAANGGSNCVLDPGTSSVTVSAGHVVSASGAGSTWQADHEVTFTNNFMGVQSQRHGLHADSGGRILLNGATATYRVTTSGPSTTHPVFAQNAGSEIRVAGNLVVTANGGSNPNASTAVRGIIGVSGGLVEVLGHTTVHMTNAIWPAGANNRALSAESGTILLHTGTLRTQGPGGIGVLSSGTTGIVRADGLVEITTAGNGAQGMAAWNSGQIALAQVQVLTAGTDAAALRNANGGGTITLAGGALRTAGAASPGIQQSLGTVRVTGPLAIATAGANSPGVALSGTGSLELGETSIRTATADSPGMRITNTAAQSTTLALNGRLDIETSGDGSSGIHMVYNTSGSLAVPQGSRLVTHGASAHGMELAAPSGDLGAWSVGAGTTIETFGSNAHGIHLTAPLGRAELASAADLTVHGDAGHGILAESAGQGVDMTNSGTITLLGTGDNRGMRADALGGDSLLRNAGAIQLGDGVGMAATQAGSGTLTLDNQGSISGTAGRNSTGMDMRIVDDGQGTARNAGTIGSASVPVDLGMSADTADAQGLVTVVNSGRIDAATAAIRVQSDGGLDISNSGTLAGSTATGVWVAGGQLGRGGTFENTGQLQAAAVGVRQDAAGLLALRNSGTISAPVALRVASGQLDVHNLAAGTITGTLRTLGGCRTSTTPACGPTPATRR